MKQIVEHLFDLFFPKDIDEKGKEIENPDGDDSYGAKVFGLVLFIIVVILTGIIL